VNVGATQMQQSMSRLRSFGRWFRVAVLPVLLLIPLYDFFQPRRVTPANFERVQQATSQEELERILGRPAICMGFGFRPHPQWTESHLSLSESFRISAVIDRDGSVARIDYDQYPLSFLGWLNNSMGIVVLAIAYIVLATPFTPLLWQSNQRRALGRD
jgi:hypothetical protein